MKEKREIHKMRVDVIIGLILAEAMRPKMEKIVEEVVYETLHKEHITDAEVKTPPAKAGKQTEEKNKKQ